MPIIANYDLHRVLELEQEIKGTCLSDVGLEGFPFQDFQLIMDPFEKHVNFRIIRAALDAIAIEKDIEVIPATTNVIGEIYKKYGAPPIQDILKSLMEKRGFDLDDKLTKTDNKPPFKSSDPEIESLWMSYEGYQLFNWICESISNDPNFLVTFKSVYLV